MFNAHVHIILPKFVHVVTITLFTVSDRLQLLRKVDLHSVKGGEKAKFCLWITGPVVDQTVWVLDEFTSLATLLKIYILCKCDAP